MPSRRSDSSAWADGLPFEQYLAEALRRLQRGELTPAEHEHLAPMFTMLGARLMSTCDDLNPKWSEALELIRRKPEDWFRGQPIDDRDRDLLNARPMPCFDLGKTSFLKKMSHKVVDEDFKITYWTVENEKQCRRMIRQAGSEFIGFNQPPVNEHRPEWHSMKLDVQVSGNIAPHIQWSLLCTMPSKTRAFAGPCFTCSTHPWDAMILRDCYAGTDGMFDIPRYGLRFFDVLLMKMCEDYDHPWIMVAVKDSGPYVPHGCCYGL